MAPGMSKAVPGLALFSSIASPLIVVVVDEVLLVLPPLLLLLAEVEEDEELSSLSISGLAVVVVVLQSSTGTAAIGERGKKFRKTNRESMPPRKVKIYHEMKSFYVDFNLANLTNIGYPYLDDGSLCRT